MAVRVLGVVLVFQPLLQLAVAADLVRGDLLPHLVELGGEFGVAAQFPGRGGRVAQEAADDRVVHRGAHHQAALLRRVRRPADQVAGERVFHEVIEEELRGRLHGRIGPLGQKLLIAGEQVLLPEMLAEPGPADDPDAVVRGVDRRRAPPEIEVMVHDPAAGPVVVLGHRLAGDGQFVDGVVQRLLALGQVGGQARASSSSRC